MQILCVFFLALAVGVLVGLAIDKALREGR